MRSRWDHIIRGVVPPDSVISKFTFMKTVLAFLVAGLLGIITLKAQDYELAAGLRLGIPVSLSLKKSLDGTNALEGFVGFRSFGFGGNALNVGGAYQRHYPLTDVTEGLSWYWGAGASVVFLSFQNDFLGVQEGSVSIGAQGYLGLEYTLEDKPVSFSLDWVPTIYISGNQAIRGFGADNGALSVRYIINR